MVRETLLTVAIEVLVPGDSQVGDDFTLTCDARIVMIRDPQIDITNMNGRQETVRGEREYKLQTLNARLIRDV